MPKLLENFTIEIGETEEIEIGSVPVANVTWDTSIPVANTPGLTFESGISNNKIYEYKTQINIFYADPNIITEPDEEGNVANNVALVLSAKLGHIKGANTIQLVLDTFPQYFTE
jgi:hypothetical protein